MDLPNYPILCARIVSKQTGEGGAVQLLFFELLYEWYEVWVEAIMAQSSSLGRYHHIVAVLIVREHFQIYLLACSSLIKLRTKYASYHIIALRRKRQSHLPSIRTHKIVVWQ